MGWGMLWSWFSLLGMLFFAALLRGIGVLVCSAFFERVVDTEVGVVAPVNLLDGTLVLVERGTDSKEHEKAKASPPSRSLDKFHGQLDDVANRAKGFLAEEPVSGRSLL